MSLSFRLKPAAKFNLIYSLTVAALSAWASQARALTAKTKSPSQISQDFGPSPQA
jgi:hypothetical protein